MLVLTIYAHNITGQVKQDDVEEETMREPRGGGKVKPVKLSAANYVSSVVHEGIISSTDACFARENNNTRP